MKGVKPCHRGIYKRYTQNNIKALYINVWNKLAIMHRIWCVIEIYA